MRTPQDHYDRFLGSVYSWMLGDREAALDEARKELRDLGVASSRDEAGIAMDLGAGTGLHSIPLAESGFTVVAVDTCRGLLDELESHMGDHAIRVVQGDLTGFRSHHPGKAAVIVCMGDTLTHLPSLQAVERLFHEVKAALVPGGLFVATFRDYVSSTLEGVSRFIPVRSDEHRILTCFLEYRERSILVHDLLQTRRAGGWETTVSAYPKLRLDPAVLQELLRGLGLSARIESGPRGMVRLVGTTPEDPA
jgi:SAM-dependent methyltransferase